MFVSQAADWRIQLAERQGFEEDDFDDEEVDAEEVSMLHRLWSHGQLLV